jgi:hypothetical protein
MRLFLIYEPQSDRFSSSQVSSLVFTAEDIQLWRAKPNKNGTAQMAQPKPALTDFV